MHTSEHQNDVAEMADDQTMKDEAQSTQLANVVRSNKVLAKSNDESVA